ncbi:MAG TPA: hypothetical protein VN723_12980 [Rhizomicrobium sp.]|nr:hypothetical protein [Rhizomicrobium sp.]
MKIEQFAVGTGITQKRKVRKTAQTLDELHQLMGTPSKSYLEYLEIIEQQAREHLRKKGLPTERATGYRKIAGRWQKVAKPPHFCSRTVIFEKEGYEEDSAVGFSARIIELAAYLRANLSAGKVEKALEYAHDLGVLTTEAKFKRKWETSALEGKARRESSKRGAAEKLRKDNIRHSKWRDTALILQNEQEKRSLPPLNHEELARRVRSRLKISKTPGTIVRALKKLGVR